MREGLRTFNPSAEQAPGRLNLYRVGNRLVIVDFAHNEAGVNVILDVAEGLVGAKKARAGKRFLSIVIGTAGDRPGRHAARHRPHRRRARRPGGHQGDARLPARPHARVRIIGELLDGVREGGGRPADVPVYEGEALAVRGELTTPGRQAAGDQPGILVIMCHADRDGRGGRHHRVRWRARRRRGSTTSRGSRPSR